MNLAVSDLEQGPKEFVLEADASAIPGLAEAGGRGLVSARLTATPLAGDSALIRGEIRGNLRLDCGRCLEILEQPFAVKFNLLAEKRDEAGLEWPEDFDGGVEDYQARLGPDVVDIPLEHIIAEQVLLNYNLHPLPALDALRRCVQCGRQSPETEARKKPDRVDPRWDKLKEFSHGSPEKKILDGPSG